MKTVWKFAIQMAVTAQLNIPKDGKVLTVQMQGDNPCIWVLVDPEAQVERRVFSVYGTGHSMPENPGTYIGTFQMLGGELVFHLFEQE